MSGEGQEGRMSAVKGAAEDDFGAEGKTEKGVPFANVAPPTTAASDLIPVILGPNDKAGDLCQIPNPDGGNPEQEGSSQDPYLISLIKGDDESCFYCESFFLVPCCCRCCCCCWPRPPPPHTRHRRAQLRMFGGPVRVHRRGRHFRRHKRLGGRG